MKPNLTKVIVLIGMFLVHTSIHAQRYMENLNRGTVAVRTSTSEVLVNWRILGDEYANGATYNLYRGTSLIASGLSVSNYVDATSTDYTYSVAAVINGTEQALSDGVSPLTNAYFTIPVRAINGSYDDYNINDASVGDLDGDGDYEIVVKRLSNDATPSATTYHYLEAYEMDGTFLWAINLGPNICNTVEVNFLVYDFDNDGKAEVATRTSDGMIDGVGTDIGDRDGDGQTNYRSTMVLNSSYYRIDGPDYISIFDGATGQEIAWDWYIDREPLEQWGTSGMSDSQLGHRATKCMWAVAYLDGVNPSFIISRGIYHRIKLEAWSYNNGSLTQEWAWDSDPNDVATAYTGQGFHNLAAGDIDGDGRDEIVYGSMAVDENGQGIYSTEFGHGDAGHLADINPNISGLEFFSCLEGANGTTIPGLSLRNASTGAIQWSLAATGDIGRCMAADIDELHYGMEIWGSEGSGIYSCTGSLISTTLPTSAGGGATYNFGVWWDGDVQRELLDRMVITKWNATNQGTDRVATLYNVTSIGTNNGTKYNPCLMADILGDWREEIIYRNGDNTGMVVFVTPYSTSQRMYTLMHDPNYRSAIAWQNNSYNQPPNLSFYFGGGMDTPPNPNIAIVGEDAVDANIVLTATAGNGEVDLSWTASLITNNYQIMRDTDSDASGRERIAITGNSVTTYTDTDVTNGTTYYYWIKSYDSDGNTVNSEVAAATPASCTADDITSYIQVDDGSWSQANSVSAAEGSTVVFGPHPTSGGSWSWLGPDSYTASTREIELTDITSDDAGVYTAVYTNSSSCVSTALIKLEIYEPTSATLTKHGGGSSIQSITLGDAISDFYYSWTDATTVTVSGMPDGITSTIDTEAQTVSFTGTPLETGTFAFTVTTVGADENTTKSGTITVTSSTSDVSIVIQENETGFCNVDGTIDSDNDGFSGDGFANSTNEAEAGIDWTINGDEGTYTFVWNYANGGGTDRTAVLYVNETSVATISFPALDDWYVWSTSSVSVELESGSKTVRLEADQSNGLANIDYMQVTSSAVAAVDCDGTDISSGSLSFLDATLSDGNSTDMSQSALIYPNPVSDILHINGQGIVYIYNLLGVKVYEKETTEQMLDIDMSRLRSGTYLIILENDEQSFKQPIIKK